MSIEVWAAPLRLVAGRSVEQRFVFYVLHQYVESLKVAGLRDRRSRQGRRGLSPGYRHLGCQWGKWGRGGAHGRRP